MNTTLIVLIIVALLVVTFVIVVVLRPDEFSVTRSATMAAPPESVFPHVNDLRNWNAWSPWAKMDPAAKNRFDGPPAGTGAAFAWEGNSKIGVGRMTVMESQPNRLVRFKLEFEKPFRATNFAEFTFTPTHQQTQVNWTMTGRSNFIFKAMGLFMNCDKLVGCQFEQGLAAMKALVEAPAKK